MEVFGCNERPVRPLSDSEAQEKQKDRGYKEGQIPLVGI
jgi:hypothetical protein